MNEILFRGKTKSGEWVEGNYEYCHKPEKHIISNVYTQTTKGVIPETVGQYTGLTANGKKIFEGDIVKVSIYYDVGCYPHTDIKIIEVKMPDIYKINIEKCIEVIGNIHDNPELLEG